MWCHNLDFSSLLSAQEFLFTNSPYFRWEDNLLEKFWETFSYRPSTLCLSVRTHSSFGGDFSRLGWQHLLQHQRKIYNIAVFIHELTILSLKCCCPPNQLPVHGEESCWPTHLQVCSSYWSHSQHGWDGSVCHCSLHFHCSDEWYSSECRILRHCGVSIIGLLTLSPCPFLNIILFLCFFSQPDLHSCEHSECLCTECCAGADANSALSYRCSCAGCVSALGNWLVCVSIQYLYSIAYAAYFMQGPVPHY